MNWLSAIGLTAERLDWLGDKVNLLLNPLASMSRLLETLGASVGGSGRSSSGGGGGFLPNAGDILGELSAIIQEFGKANDTLEETPDIVLSAGGAASKATDQFQDLMEALFPENITRRQREMLRIIDQYAGRISDTFQARLRALGVSGQQDLGSLVDTGPLQEAGEVEAAAARVAQAMEDQTKKAQTQTVQIADSFRDMAQDTIGSLQSITDAIKGGDFLSILGSTLDLILQLGSFGVFGGGFQAKVNAPIAGARADGGPVSAGKTYLVGERGPELFTPGRSGGIVSNDNMMAGAPAVQIVPSPYFDVVVDGRIQTAAPGIVQGGANLARSQDARARRRVVRR
ncbi:MAG: hypothetical protein AAFY81_10170, partial [Pseudomonadota bacterium]